MEASFLVGQLGIMEYLNGVLVLNDLQLFSDV